MRVFIISVLFAVVSAAPQYNYQAQQNVNIPTAGVPDRQSLLQDALQNQKVQQALLAPFPNANQQFSIQQQIPFREQHPINGVVLKQQYVPQVQYVHQGSQQQQFNYQTASLAPVVTKDIYVHAAPEEPEEQYVAPPQAPLPPRKHYRIVFIKAPTQRVSPVNLRLTQAPIEEKTIIYVLSKKPEPLDLQTVFQDATPKPQSKPEVYFIKYKTQEEAVHAQRTIQAQFDSLGGTSDVSDEGIAPVTSVIGALQNQQQITLPGVQQGNGGQGYLPPGN